MVHLLGGATPSATELCRRAGPSGTEHIIANLEANLKVSGADLVEKVKGVILFCIGDRRWTLDLASGSGSVREGELEGESAPDLTLTMNDDTFSKLVSGKLAPQQAFIFRKLKIKGGMAMAMKVTPILQAARSPPSKL